MTGEKLTVGIAEFSAQWEGRTIAGTLPLRKFVGGSEDRAVFLTTYDSRNAAIKLIVAEAESADRQLARWRDAAKLSHINLVRIFDVGRCEIDDVALVYVVTEYAEENLSQVLPDRPLTAVEAREMLDPALSAIEYVHRQGFVHGHLKPSNIMAVEDRLKISSDGLSKSGSDDGSPASPYDPPERASGAVSPAGDVWSLGITLAEVLTQRRPVGGSAPQGLPEPFAGIVRGCLHGNPAERLSITQISKLLGQPEAAGVLPARKKRYAPVGLIILLVLLVIVVGGVMLRQSDTGGSQTAPAPQAVKAPGPQTPPEQKQEPAPPPRVTKPPKEEAKSEPVTEPQRAPEAAPKETPSAPETASAAPVSGIQSQPLPEITDQARSTIHGRVRVNVRVEVGPSGAVTDAKLESGSNRYFGERAVAAVRQWKFDPVTANGSEVGQRWRVRFEFQKNGTKVQPQRTSP